MFLWYDLRKMGIFGSLCGKRVMLGTKMTDPRTKVWLPHMARTLLKCPDETAENCGSPVDKAGYRLLP